MFYSWYRRETLNKLSCTISIQFPLVCCHILSTEICHKTYSFLSKHLLFWNYFIYISLWLCLSSCVYIYIYTHIFPTLLQSGEDGNIPEPFRILMQILDWGVCLLSCSHLAFLWGRRWEDFCWLVGFGVVFLLFISLGLFLLALYLPFLFVCFSYLKTKKVLSTALWWWA